MRNILKKVMIPLLATPIIVAPLTTIACTRNYHDINKDLDTTDLGFVEDLSSKTIIKAFSQKNPRVKMKAIDTSFIEGNSHQGIIRVWPQNYYHYEPKGISITYQSKLDYNETNKEEYQLTGENNQITIDFKILDVNKPYDDNFDKKISCFSDIDPYEWKTFEHRIDKATKNYQIIISLNNLKDESPQSLPNYFSIIFRWGDKNYTSKQGVILGEINIDINV